MEDNTSSYHITFIPYTEIREGTRDKTIKGKKKDHAPNTRARASKDHVIGRGGNRIIYLQHHVTESTWRTGSAVRAWTFHTPDPGSSRGLDRFGFAVSDAFFFLISPPTDPLTGLTKISPPLIRCTRAPPLMVWSASQQIKLPTPFSSPNSQSACTG